MAPITSRRRRRGRLRWKSNIVNQILFVDSDPQALDALKTAIEAQETGWNATFVTSGQAALNLLSNRWFDVIFTELRLQGMDGAQLLEHVKLHHPSIIRVLLAEPLENDQLDRAIAVAQRFVAKPWDMQTLVASLESVLGAWPRTDNPLVRTIVGRLASLPSASSTYPRLVNVMAHPNATIEQISTVIASDPALSAKLLQVVNSAFFGLPFKVASVPQAVSYLGLTSLRALVLMSITVATLLWFDLSNRFVWIVLVVTLGFGMIGWADDWRKVVNKDPEGMRSREKYFWQSVIGLIAALYLVFSISESNNVRLVELFFEWVRSGFDVNLPP